MYAKEMHANRDGTNSPQNRGMANPMYTSTRLDMERLILTHSQQTSKRMLFWLSLINTTLACPFPSMDHVVFGVSQLRTLLTQSRGGASILPSFFIAQQWPL